MISTETIDYLVLLTNGAHPALVGAAIIIGGAVAFYLGWGFGELLWWMGRGCWMVIAGTRRIFQTKGGHF